MEISLEGAKSLMSRRGALDRLRHDLCSGDLRASLSCFRVAQEMFTIQGIPEEHKPAAKALVKKLEALQRSATKIKTKADLARRELDALRTHREPVSCGGQLPVHVEWPTFDPDRSRVFGWAQRVLTRRRMSRSFIDDLSKASRMLYTVRNFDSDPGPLATVLVVAAGLRGVLTPPGPLGMARLGVVTGLDPAVGEADAAEAGHLALQKQLKVQAAALGGGRSSREAEARLHETWSREGVYELENVCNAGLLALGSARLETWKDRLASAKGHVASRFSPVTPRDEEWSVHMDWISSVYAGLRFNRTALLMKYPSVDAEI